MLEDSTASQPLSNKEKRDLDVEISFLEGLTKRDPKYVEALQLLGDDYTKRDRFHDGLTVDEHLSRLLPEDSMVYYNLACSYSLTDRIDESITALNKAVRLGYNDPQWMDIDPDLSNVRTDPRYKRIRRQLDVKYSSH
ncbi:MAG TPA: hypothetical protein QGG93_08095 [Verrucomicrobiota bacterium]|jgi:predicted Zn-dependent protease|nr:hypothetical protein [Verrucomicrobiota bacterium]|tara:strand:- start:296 stop:709 length:414 start_codon:yes stop_codon:yes gene_type:complete